MALGPLEKDVIDRALDRKLAEIRAAKKSRPPKRLRIAFPDASAKACYIDGAAQEDARLKPIRELAAVVKGLPPDVKAQELYAFVRRNCRYLLDVDGEEFDDAASTLIAGQDDCDGTARCLVALCLAAGLDACVRAVMRPDGSQVEHFQAMVRWPGSTAWPKALPGGWMLCDTTLKGVALGDGAEAGIEREDGSLVAVNEVQQNQIGEFISRSR